MISALTAGAHRALARERVLVTNLRRAHEPAAVTVSLSTPRDRSFVTYDGVNADLQHRLPAAIRRRPAAHIHFAFAPDDCGAWARFVRRLRARGVGTSWGFGWDPPLRARAGFGELVREVDIVFMNEPESRLYARARRTARGIVVKRGRHGSRWIATSFDIGAAAPRVR